MGIKFPDLDPVRKHIKAIFYSKDPTFESIILDATFNGQYIIIDMVSLKIPIQYLPNEREFVLLGKGICDFVVDDNAQYGPHIEFLCFECKAQEYCICVDKYHKQLIEILKKLETTSI